MKLKVYSIYDKKGEQFGDPTLRLTHGEAERDFRDMASHEKSPVSKHPHDYDLYFLGEFSRIDGKMRLLDSPQHITNGAVLQSNAIPQI